MLHTEEILDGIKKDVVEENLTTWKIDQEVVFAKAQWTNIDISIDSCGGTVNQNRHFNKYIDAEVWWTNTHSSKNR